MVMSLSVLLLGEGIEEELVRFDRFVRVDMDEREVDELENVVCAESLCGVVIAMFVRPKWSMD